MAFGPILLIACVLEIRPLDFSSIQLRPVAFESRRPFPFDDRDRNSMRHEFGLEKDVNVENEFLPGSNHKRYDPKPPLSLLCWYRRSRQCRDHQGECAIQLQHPFVLLLNQFPHRHAGGDHGQDVFLVRHLRRRACTGRGSRSFLEGAASSSFLATSSGRPSRSRGRRR